MKGFPGLQELQDAPLRSEEDGPWDELLRDARTESWLEEVLPDSADPWPITAETGRFLSRLVLSFKRRRVLEFGAGASSCVLARSLARGGGGSLTSVEQKPEWCRERWQEVRRTPGVDARLVVSEPRLTIGKTGPHYAYKTALPEIAARGPYDLVFIDAPQGYYGRDGSLHLAYEHLEPGAFVVLDDAGRPSERVTLQRWLRTYPGLRLVLFEPRVGDRGVAVLRFAEGTSSRFDPWAVMTSAQDLWRSRRERQRLRRRFDRR